MTIDAAWLNAKIENTEGMTNAKVGKHLGIDSSAVSRMRGNSGGRKISADEAQKLLAFFGDERPTTPSGSETPQVRRYSVTKAGAGPTIQPGVEPAVTLSLDLKDGGELIASLPPREASWLRDQIQRSLDRIAESQEVGLSSSHPSSA